MRLDLRFSARPLEEFWCQAVTGFVFQRPNVTTGPMAGLNAKMADSLTDLIEKEVWTGKKDESFLMATQSMIKADKLLFYGLGEFSDFSVSVLIKGAVELGISLDKLGIDEFAVLIPETDSRVREYLSHLRTSACHLVEPFLKKHKDDPDYLLRIFYSVEGDLIPVLGPLVKELRKHFTDRLDFTIVVDNPTVLEAETVAISD
ncbi:MAG: hypothetical protein JRJ06_01840 [Deltaproteobacteria bacterium]|nr:hypothetical protein [Deltaproteobacteria bacterium]